jgi:hypothetical protein
MVRWTKTLLLTGLLLPAGCKQTSATQVQTATPEVKVAPQTPLAEKKDELGTSDSDGWTPALDAYVEKNLPPDLLSAQAAKAVHSYCPAFGQISEVDKRTFWAYTMQAIAAAEAGLKPTADVHHTEAAVAKTDAVTHRAVRQQGLMQVTYEDAQRYGCDFDWAADSKLPEKDPKRTILQPEANLACGLKIMDNQIITQGKPLLVRTSYWSTLQPGTQSYRVFAKQMANVPAACGTHAQQRTAKTSKPVEQGSGSN